MSDDGDQDIQGQDHHLLRDQWRRRTIRALIISRVATLLAIGSFVAGIGIYFASFNFGSGGDSRGMIVLIAALCLGVVAVIGNLFGIVAASVTWRYAGSAWWLAIIILLPVLETVTFALIWCAL